MTERINVPLETPFQVARKSFAISESSSGYTLQVSVDCKSADDASATWSNFSDAIAANKPHLVVEVASGLWWRLYGNTDANVFVRF